MAIKILNFYTLFFITASFISFVCSQTENNTDDSILSTTSVSVPTTQSNQNASCEIHNGDCKACIAKSECYYCSEKSACHYHIESLISDSKCKIKDVYFLTCKMSLKVMIILIGILAGIVTLIIIIVCCYCCCKKKGIKLSKDDLKWARQKEERKQISAERRKERTERADEMRKKYGLVKDSNPYQRFDA